MKNILCFENPLFLKTCFFEGINFFKNLFEKKHIWKLYFLFFMFQPPPPLKKTDFFFFVLKKQFSKKATKNNFFFLKKNRLKKQCKN